MSTTAVRRNVYVALPTPRGSTRVHCIEMADVVSGRDLRINVGLRGSAPSALGRAVSWLRRLAFHGSQ